MKLTPLLAVSFLLFPARADKACGFSCGINTIAGCCAQYFTNAFDEYAFGTGCMLTPISARETILYAVLTLSVCLGQFAASFKDGTKWKCEDTTLIPGCCDVTVSLLFSEYLDVMKLMEWTDFVYTT
jgi:hypothetical protein